MRYFRPILLLLAARVGITMGHFVNVPQIGESPATSALNDVFFRRLDPIPPPPPPPEPIGDYCCGMCTQIKFSVSAALLLLKTGSENGGQLNPAILIADGSTAFNIIIRITLIYLDAGAQDPTVPLTLEFDAIVQPEDWTPVPCTFLQDDCIVFQNEELLLFAPDADGLSGTLSLEAFDQFTAESNVTVISSECDVRCEDANVCSGFEPTSGVLEPTGDGISFGDPVESLFQNGFCDPSIFDDPHVTGLRGQRFDWCGEDGGWYAFLSTPDELQMNLRVTSHLPTTFPERQLVTGVAVVTEGHTIKAEIVDPLDLTPTCAGSGGSTSAPCLVNGGLRVTVDGREEMRGAGEFHYDGGIHITAVNLPLECQRFGDYLMWGNLDEEQKLMYTGRNLRSTGAITSIFDWLLMDSVMIAPPWCVKYLEELNGDVTALAGIQSNHAVLRIVSPILSLRVNVGINSEEGQTLQDGRVVPTASFWQMDVRIEDAKDIAIAKGMLGETARPVHDKETGKRVMSGLGVLRGDVEDYRVMHPLGTEFKQLFVPEE